MGEVLSYPLTPAPFAICHVDGTMQKSQKSILLKYLETTSVSHRPITTNVTVIHGMFFLHLYSNLPAE